MRVRTHTNPLHFYRRLEPIDFTAIWPSFDGKLDLEIGFGRGLFMRHYAKLHPERFIVGVEVRKLIVSLLEEHLQKEEIFNAHLVHSSAQFVMEDIVPDKSLERVFVFHPDPWFKKKHHKRRVINDDFLKVLSQKLVLGGKLYLSTDVQELWEDMQLYLREFGQFTPLDQDPFWETTYKTHWQQFSENDNRSRFTSTYVLG